ncbi:MAG: hypothetical protein RPU72_02375 [Candidatus Sedimenticola sp. (ex Thyasira tokunagai)]
MKNKIEDLRDHLFATLEALQDEDKPMDLDRAKAISDVAQTMINSAKVEVEYMKTTGAIKGSGFIPDAPRQPAIPHRPAQTS